MTTEDRLTKLRHLVAQARDKELEIAALEERLKQLTSELQTLQMETLPDNFDVLGISSITLEAEGNLPAFVASMKPFYRANIAANWPEAKRAEAFEVLTNAGGGDLIKSVVMIAFPKERRDEASALVEELRKRKFAAQCQESVSWQTLTAWLKEIVESGDTIPPLEPLGATVGRKVSLKEKR